MATQEPLPTIEKYRTGQLDLESATLRVLLFDDSQSYDIDRVNHEYVDDVIGTAATELSGTGYARKDVANAQVSVDSGDTEVVFDADDVQWSELDGGEEVQGWLVYAQVGGDDSTPGDDPIVAIEDEVTNANGNPLTTNGSPVTLSFDAEGIMTVS